MPPIGRAEVEFKCLVKIPLRDGVHLSAIVYTPKNQFAPAPCVCALTPYCADHLHDRGVYFAARGLPFVAVDVRGRGDSEGQFRPLIQEAQDGYDVVEWLAQQPYCNGKVGMYGGSYLGYAQWAAAKEFPPHLVTIVPTAAPYMGVDVPMRNNIFSPYYAQWLTTVSGHVAHDKLFADQEFWSGLYRQWFESGTPLREVDRVFGNPSSVFQEWLDHPERDDYWDSYNPTASDYARLQIPILTITGAYDGDQPGALEHYKRHFRAASTASRARHHLVIGPWNHTGCAVPSTEFEGLKVGQASVLDMHRLHFEWYAWTMMDGPKPEFLQNNVAYYVTGAEHWRYAATLEEVTASYNPLYLQSNCSATDVFMSGSLVTAPPTSSESGHYLYDPRDVSLAEMETKLDFDTQLVDQSLIHASIGKRLFYHSAPFQEDVEVSGFFKLIAWISIDQPDTDFRVWVYEIDNDGNSVLLATDSMRARYRESLRKPTLIQTREPLRYEFEGFTFVSRLIQKKNRLRVVIGPINSIREEKNYNGGGCVSEESKRDARTVAVRLIHDFERPTALYLPVARRPDAGSAP